MRFDGMPPTPKRRPIPIGAARRVTAAWGTYAHHACSPGFLLDLSDAESASQLGVCSRFLTCVQALEVPRACRGLNTVLCNYRWTCRAVRWHMADLQLAIMQHNLRAWFPRFAAGFARQATSGIAVDLLSTKSGWGGGRCSLWPVPFPRPLQTRRKWHAFSPNTVHGRRTGTGGRAAALLPVVSRMVCEGQVQCTFLPERL